MINNQTYFPEENSSLNNSNGSSQSGSITFVNGKKRPINPLMVRLQKMEILNKDFRDMLDQRTKELADSVAANTKSITIIAHDLRGPFCNVLAALELIKEKLNHHNTDDIDEYLNIASSSAKNAVSLLDNLVKWALLQNKGLEFNPVKINLKEFIGREIENIAAAAKHKNIGLNYYIAPDLNVYLDIDMVRTILRNLISNAIKFTDAGGKVTVSARECNPYVEVMVSDNGIGISSDDQTRIFNNEKFLVGPLLRNRQGTGLGLKLCKEFAEIHGGQISVDSIYGKGSRFTFSVPCSV